MPFNSYNIFNDFFTTHPFKVSSDMNFFKPLMLKSSSLQKDIEKDMLNMKNMMNMDIESLGPNTEYAESFKSESFREKGAQGLTGRTISEKTELKNGKKRCVKTEELLKADGTKEVTETICENNEVKTNKYMLQAGQDSRALTC